MLKIISAIAAAALIAGAIVLLPGAANDVKAGMPEPAVQSDRLMTEAAPACSNRGWPYYDHGCVRENVRPVRLVTTDRI